MWVDTRVLGGTWTWRNEAYHYDAVGNRINVVYSSSGSTPSFPQMVYEVDGFVSIGGDTTEITLSKDTIIFSETTLANLGENITIAGDGALVTNNSDTTIVNFGEEVRVDSAKVSSDPVIFHGFVSIAGDTTEATLYVHQLG